MTSPSDGLYEADPTPSRLVVERYRAALEEAPDDPECSLALVHYRGGRHELELGLEYSYNADPKDREVGADVLGQLGWANLHFLDESVERLIELLSDEYPQVICSAAYALGHRRDPRAIPHLVPLAAHPEDEVRRSVVSGLNGHEDHEAITALITLSGDACENVRNWATFGLGSLIKTDTAAVRRALWRALADDCAEIRGEALVGLAKRRAPGVIDAIIREWQEHEDIDWLSVDAAAEFEGFPEDGELRMHAGETPFEDYRLHLIKALEDCRPASLLNVREPRD